MHPNEKLNDDQWCEVAHAWLDGMGFTNNQFILSRHTDTKHPHIHILVNRISLDGRVVSDSHDYKRQEVIMRKLEKEYGLVQVPSRHEVGRKSPTKGEVEHALRTNQPSARMTLQNLIDTALSSSHDTNFFTFSENLNSQGVEIKLNKASTGTVSGISFSLDNVAFKGSKLGKGYTWKSLQTRGLIYENGHITQHEHEQANTKREYTNANNNTDRTDNTNNTANSYERTRSPRDETSPSEPTRNPEIAKQRRIDENFARLEQEYQRSDKRSPVECKRSQNLSR